MAGAFPLPSPSNDVVQRMIEYFEFHCQASASHMPFGIAEVAAGIIMRLHQVLSSCTLAMAAAAIALALAGCADPPPCFLDPKVATSLHTIALAVPPEPRVGYSLLSSSGLAAIPFR